MSSWDAEYFRVPAILCNDASIIYLPSETFAQICRNLSQFSEIMVITSTEQCVKFSIPNESNLENACSMSITLLATSDSYEPEDSVIIEGQQPFEMTYSLDYLLLMIEATPLSTKVKLTMYTQYPMMVEYIIQGYGHLRYYMAPLTVEEHDLSDVTEDESE